MLSSSVGSPAKSRKGLLPLLKSIQRPTELRKYAGQTLGVDGYGWLHRGAVACAIELAQGKPTRKYVDFAMHRIRMFKHFGVTPYVVFDGDFLPSKAKTEASRAKRREESKRIGFELLRAGKPSQAYSELQKAIDVTPEMARHLIEELKKADVPYVVAPYEADAQLVYLERQGLISGIVSEDSDLLVFGAKRLLTKLDQHGQCVEINRKDFCAVREISLTGWTDREFRHMAIFSGCDYLDGVSNIGLKTAYRLIRKHKTPERIIKMLRFDGKYQIPDSYLEDFKQAELTFLHQRVFCPKKQDIVFLTELDPSSNPDEMPFIGAPVETELARSIAIGDVNPITKERIVVPRSPGKRRISQTLAPVNGPPRALGKPISEYFKDRGDRRIPLGEMDPNCFAIDPNNSSSTTAEERSRPIVFPLPRPYVEGAEEALESRPRPYTGNARPLRRKTEPISKLLGLDLLESSEHRRRTTGPAMQVYQDPAAASRPPKKARLCDEQTFEESADVTPEKSKFFSAKPKKSGRKKEDKLLMSDDSIEEAFRSLPDHSWRSEKPPKPTDDIAIFQDPSPKKQTDAVPPAESPIEGCKDHADHEIEVPASSPTPQGSAKEDNCDDRSASMTPLGEFLKEFSYGTGHTRTRVIHGLPTPASSVEQAVTPKCADPVNTQTPMPTPLQRIGARALQRSKFSSIFPTQGSISSSDGSNKFDSLPADPAFIPLPKVDFEEVEALNKPLGSEDQIIPDSDGEDDDAGDEPGSSGAVRRLNLSRFLYS
ncbi:hypothetical protein VTH82DRAFT_6380 [Thermothelomyces myriococcoides]